MLRKSLIVLALASAQCLAATPSQFIAKQYSEALGRAPDPGAWRNFLAYGARTECNATLLRDVAVSVFSSGEYASKGYTPEEQVLTLYRALLSREPDAGGLPYWADLIRRGMTAAQMAPHLINSPEFAGLVPQICSGKGYRPDGDGRQAIDIGGGTWTQAQLQSCIASNTVCRVPVRTVVYLTSTLTIPAGKVLETAGQPDRYQYARQARLVRASANPGHMVVLQTGATIRNIWLSGQRHLYKQGLVASPNGQANVFANINYVGGAGGIGSVTSVRSDAPLTATHVQTFPVPIPVAPTTYTDFVGNAIISDNLMTGYAHAHTYAADGAPATAPVVWTDGVSHHLANGTITGNHIIDPSDVGIVIFGHDRKLQNSSASGNVIVHAGIDAYGSLGLDTIQCLLSYNTCQFGPAAGFAGNTILAGPLQHSDVMLFNGTGAWFPPTCSSTDPATAPYSRCGTGGRMVNNTTENVPVMVQLAQSVDGMHNALMHGNQLTTTRVNNLGNLRAGCLRNDANGQPAMVANATPDHASGILPPGLAVHSHAGEAPCIGH